MKYQLKDNKMWHSWLLLKNIFFIYFSFQTSFGRVCVCVCARTLFHIFLFLCCAFVYLSFHFATRQGFSFVNQLRSDALFLRRIFCRFFRVIRVFWMAWWGCIPNTVCSYNTLLCPFCWCVLLCVFACLLVCLFVRLFVCQGLWRNLCVLLECI